MSIYETTSSPILAAQLGQRLAQLRLSHGLRQDQLAQQSGLSTRTLRRFEAGEGASLDTFLRLLIAFDIQSNLTLILPDAAISPLDRVTRKPRIRQRARASKSQTAPLPWAWADTSQNND